MQSGNELAASVQRDGSVHLGSEPGRKQRQQSFLQECHRKVWNAQGLEGTHLSWGSFSSHQSSKYGKRYLPRHKVAISALWTPLQDPRSGRRRGRIGKQRTRERFPPESLSPCPASAWTRFLNPRNCNSCFCRFVLELLKLHSGVEAYCVCWCLRVITGLILVECSAMANELDDVEDGSVISSNGEEGEASPPEDEATEFLRKGNRDFRNSRFQEAIACYTKALQGSSVDHALLYSNRCAAYCRWSKFLRSIPARVSEESAIYELDPMSLGQLALRDAEKVVKLRSHHPKTYLRKATAQILLEQYEAAVETYISGLETDPTNKPLQDGLREVKTLMEGAEHSDNKRRKLERSDDLDCTLCLKLLHQPITTPCGHSFCRQCLLQALDHGNKCPICRTVIFVSPKTYPISVTLNNLIQRNFPEEFEERKAEMDAVTQAGGETLPLFVMDVVLPMQHMILNIFEPRYRLMIRRVVEGNHRFGMVRIEESGSLAEVACEVEITECEPLADGRIHIEVVGKRRFRMTETWEQDGYRVARVQWLQDTVHPDDSPEKEQLDRSVQTAADLVNSFISRAREIARSDRRLLELLNRTEGMPNVREPERFSFWVANLLHTSTRERLQYLRMTNTQERVSREITRLRSMSADHNCRIQ